MWSEVCLIVEYANVVKDFARRTKRNLDTLKDLQESHPDLKVYEVTQLVNSMLGLLVFPQQRYINEIPSTSLDELASRGWPIPRVVGDYPQVENLNQLLRYLRNAIAHFNIEFLSDSDLQIEGIRVWNRYRGKTTWQVELTLEDIEGITAKFIQMLLEEDTHSEL